MQIENYFDFFAEDDIRIKGTRIGIETVLYEYIHRCQSPEEIENQYASLTLEQVYATILYYWHNQDAVTTYLNRWLDYCLKAEQTQEQNPTPLVQRLLQLKAERYATTQSAASPV